MHAMVLSLQRFYNATYYAREKLKKVKYKCHALFWEVLVEK